MKRLPPKWTKVLKMFHLLFVAVWLGGGVALLMLASIIRPDTAAEAHMHARVLYAIDMYMIVVFAMALLLTSLLYSVFTHWGFIKHGWVIVKWGILVFQILFGALVLGPYITDNVFLAKNMTRPLSDYPEYFTNLDKTIPLGAFQLALLLFVIFISVWKPWGRTKQVQQTASVPTAAAEATPEQ